MKFPIALILLILSHFSHDLLAQQTGIASFYTEAFEGKKTASGEIYSGEKYTAAHRLLPFGALVKVTHLGNKRSVIVKINDMGPSTPERLIHLSMAAAQYFSMTQTGVAQVQLEIIAEYPDEIPKGVRPGPVAGGIPPAQYSQASTNSRSLSTSYQQPQAATVQQKSYPSSSSTPAEQTQNQQGFYTNSKAEGSLFRSLTNQPTQEASPGNNTTRSLAPPPSPPETYVTKAAKGAGLFKFQCYRVKTSGYALQLGAFSDYRNLLETTHALANEGIEDVMVHSEVRDDTLILRVLVGPFSSREKAKAFMPRLNNLEFESHVIDLTGY